MKTIPGRLIASVLPDDSVRLTFLPVNADAEAVPIIAKDIEAAEFLFVNCGLSVERAAEFKAEIVRDRGASMNASVDEEIALRFRRGPSLD